jgi:TRAP-type C4-dicarboxylate transport system permease small subunit
MWAEDLIDRYNWKAASAFATAAVVTIALAMAWLTWSPFRPTGGLDVSSVIEFLNRDGHDQYRYLTLGFGNALPKLSTYANAGSVDGEYNSARLLPEMTNYGSAQFTSAKFFGTAGMESLKAMLRHANHYGLKYIFVYDPYYDPLLVFTGWRQIETFNQGAITAWVKDDVGPAHKIYSDAMPTPFEGLLWGTLPIASSILAIFLIIALPDRRREHVDNVLTISATPEPVYAREVRP